MGPTGWIFLIVVAVVAVAVIALLRRNVGKQRTETTFRGLGFSVSSKTSSEVPAGVVIENATSREGKIILVDETGRGTRAGGTLDAKGDISFTNKALQDGPPPK